MVLAPILVLRRIKAEATSKSSSAHRTDIERAYELGANGFVVKPANTEKRVELAKLLGAFWLEFNEGTDCLRRRAGISPETAQTTRRFVSCEPVTVFALSF